MSDKKPQKRAAIGSAYEERDLGEISDLQIVLRLWGYMRPYAITFTICLVLLPVISGMQLAQPWLLEIAIDDFLVPGETDGLEWVVGAFAAAVAGQAFFHFTQFYLMQWAGQRALRDLRQEVFTHVQDLSVSFFNRSPVGRLMARMTTDIESLQEALSSGMITMLGDMFTLTAIVAILLYKDWRFALVSFTIVPFLLVLTAIFRHFMRRAYRKIRVKIARLYAHLQESISGMPIIQLFVRERVSAQEYRDINVEYRDANFMSIRYDAMLYAVVEAVGSITVGVIIWYGSGQVLQDLVTLGVLVAFIEYMQKFFVPIRDLAQKYNLLQSAMASSERVFQLLDEREQLSDNGSRPTPEDELRIEFRNVSFSYKDDEPVLQNMSFVVEPGEKIAFVGHTGAGKSTVIRLLMRLYDPDEGSILLNGIDIREFDLKSYRDRFAIVLQDVFLFTGSIRENITMGKNFDEKEVVEAAMTVHADKLIRRYRDSYDHTVQERGNNLSSGEKQLLAFARALIQKPNMLVLDEATANVDTETEALVQDAVETLMQRQTSIVIAHRLSTIQKCDRILVLKSGKVIEQGSHEELLAKRGHYHTLYRLQYAA